MRTISTTMFLSLDGVVQGLGRPDEDTRGGFVHGGWGGRYNDEDMARTCRSSGARRWCAACTRPGSSTGTRC